MIPNISHQKSEQPRFCRDLIDSVEASCSKSIAVQTVLRFLFADVSLSSDASSTYSFFKWEEVCEVIINVIYPAKTRAEVCKRNVLMTVRTVLNNIHNGNGEQPQYIFVYFHHTFAWVLTVMLCAALFSVLRERQSFKVNFYIITIITPGLAKMTLCNYLHLLWSWGKFVMGSLAWFHYIHMQCDLDNVYVRISRHDHYFLQSLSCLFHNVITFKFLHINFFWCMSYIWNQVEWSVSHCTVEREIFT